MTDQLGTVAGDSTGIPPVTVLIPIHRTKGNREWLQQAISSFPKGTPYMVLENTGNVPAAFNAGLKAADTEFVLPFGADDVATPGMLQRLLALSWNADVVYPGMIVTDENLQQIGDHYAAPFCGNRLLDMNYISGAALIRRSKALEVGGYRNLKSLEDWDLWVRMHRAGARFKACPQAQLVYRRHDESRNSDIAGNMEKLGEWREKIVLRHGPFGMRHQADPLDGIKATFYNAETPATTYLRCQLPARHLPGIVRPDLLIAEDEDRLLFPEHRGDAAVFQLAAQKATAFGAIALRNDGVRVLLETDDNYLASPGKQIRERQGWGKKIGDGPSASAQGHRWIAEHVDGVIVTTEFLARQYRKVNPNVYICPNTVDPVDWLEPAQADDGVLRILWTASLSHADDVPLVTRAFEWASRQSGVEVYVAGLNPRWQFRHGYLPWFDDLDAYRSHFRHFDVGVAPIKPSPFMLGRSDVKALEYAMGGCVPVLSDVAPYDAWTDGENCLKAKDAKGFLRAIQHLVENRDEVKQLAAAARAYTLDERTTAAQIHCWQEALDG